MHGTFPPRSPQHRPRPDLGSFWTSLAFAAMPMIVAAVVAAIRFGSAVTVGDIIEILVAATKDGLM
jgi:hypothetical protein